MNTPSLDAYCCCCDPAEEGVYKGRWFPACIVNGEGAPVSGEDVADSTESEAMLSDSPVDGRVLDIAPVGL